MENLKPPENTSPPYKKNSIAPPDKIFNPPPPNEIVISLKKNFNLLQKKTQSTTPDIITPSLKNRQFYGKNFLVHLKISQFSAS